MGTLELLKPDGPKAEIYLNMNVVYLRLDQHLNCSSQEPTAIKVAFTAMVDGVADPTLDYQSYEIPTWQLTNLVSHDDVPDYNFEVDIKNLEYQFDFLFIFEYLDNDFGGIEMHSKTTTINIDNRATVINSRVTNRFVLAELNYELLSRDDFTLFFEYPGHPDINTSSTNDIIITMGGLRILQIMDFDTSGNYIIDSPLDIYFNLINYLLGHVNLPRIAQELPATGSDTLVFKLLRNKEILYCTMVGDLTKLKEENERIPSEI